MVCYHQTLKQYVKSLSHCWSLGLNASNWGCGEETNTQKLSRQTVICAQSCPALQRFTWKYGEINLHWFVDMSEICKSERLNKKHTWQGCSFSCAVFWQKRVQHLSRFLNLPVSLARVFYFLWICFPWVIRSHKKVTEHFQMKNSCWSKCKLRCKCYSPHFCVPYNKHFHSFYVYISSTIVT